jgi:hypothetical protein
MPSLHMLAIDAGEYIGIDLLESENIPRTSVFSVVRMLNFGSIIILSTRVFLITRYQPNTNVTSLEI